MLLQLAKASNRKLKRVCFKGIATGVLQCTKSPYSTMDYLVNFYRALVVANTVADAAISPVDNHIGLVFSSNAFGFVNGSRLFPVFGGDAFVPLTAYRPILLIGHHVLVPGSGSVLCSGALKKNVYQFNQNRDPRFRGILSHKVSITWPPRYVFVLTEF